MLLLACLLSGVLSQALLPISIKPGTAKFYDSAGRQRIFHGLNVVYKGPPYLPIQDHYDPQLSFSQEDIDYFNEWGLNVIRLGFMWPGAEIANGTFNQTYLQNAVNLVNSAAQGGIYSLLDAHQDVLSEVLCGEGIPAWATKPKKDNFPEPLHSPFAIDPNTGNPSYSDCVSISWSNYYFTEATSSAFQALYSNDYGLADSFGNFWGTAALLFKDNPNVLGFELLNEPFAGDIYSNILLMEPEKADLLNLQPFYDRVAPYIRDVDSSRLVFFEPVTWSDLTNQGILGVGFTHVPGGEIFNETSVLSFHYYVPPNWSPLNGPGGYFDRRLDAINNLSCGGMLTEFEIQTGNDLIETADICDLHQISWIGWEYKTFDGAVVNGTCTGCGQGPIFANGSINYPLLREISRTYAQAVCGDIISMSFNSSTSLFILQFSPHDCSNLPTEIYLNVALHYPNGYTVDITPPGAVTWSSPKMNYIEAYTQIQAPIITFTILQ